MVGAVRFELTTSCTRNKRASQATLRPDSEAGEFAAAGPKGNAVFWRSGAQLDTTTKERRLQPAEETLLPCCRVNAAFLSAAFGREGGGAKLRPSSGRAPGLWARGLLNAARNTRQGTPCSRANRMERGDAG